MGGGWGEAPESQRGVGFTTNLQWSGVTSPCVLRPWSKRNQENYLMRSCRGREWGHGVRSLGGSGGEAWRSEQRKEERGWESEQNWGEQGVRVQEGGPKSWLRREGGQLESWTGVRTRGRDRPEAFPGFKY